MLSGLFRAICQVGIFMICAQTIVHFRPNGSYEKYLKMLVSVMLLIQIFLPIAKIFSGEAGMDIEERVEWFEQNLEEVTRKTVGNAFRSEDILEKMTLKEVQDKLAEQSGNPEASDIGKENYGNEVSSIDSEPAGEGAENKNTALKVEKIRVKVGKNDEAEGK